MKKIIWGVTLIQLDEQSFSAWKTNSLNGSGMMFFAHDSHLIITDAKFLASFPSSKLDVTSFIWSLNDSKLSVSSSGFNFLIIFLFLFGWFLFACVGCWSSGRGIDSSSRTGAGAERWFIELALSVAVAISIWNEKIRKDGGKILHSGEITCHRL